MKRRSVLRLSAAVTLLAIAVGLLFAVNSPLQLPTEKAGSAQLFFVDGLTHELPAATDGATAESRLDEAVKTVFFRLRSDSAVSADICAYITPALVPLARTEGRGFQGEDSGESG